MKVYLVDFENVKSKGLSGVDSLTENDSVIIFYSENSDTISFEMHQKVLSSKAEIEYLKEVFKLSEGEASFLVTCTKGEGLLKVGADTTILQITPTKKEFEFVETNLNKMVEMRKRSEENSYYEDN